MDAYLGPRRAVLTLLVFPSPIPRGDGGGIFPKPPLVCLGGLFGIGVRWGFVEVFVMPCVPIRDHPQIAFQFTRKDDADDAPVPVSTFKRNAHGAVCDHPSKMQAGGGPEGLGLFGRVYFSKAHLVLGVPSRTVIVSPSDTRTTRPRISSARTANERTDKPARTANAENLIILMGVYYTTFWPRME